MKKKGFVFAETIIVITVVCVAILSLYTLFYSAYNEENKRMYYDLPEDLYALSYIRKYLYNNNVNSCKNNFTVSFKEITHSDSDDYTCVISEKSEDSTEESEASTEEPLEILKEKFECDSLYLINGSKVTDLKKSKIKNYLDPDVIDYLKTLKKKDDAYYLVGKFNESVSGNDINNEIDTANRVASIEI